MSAAAGSFTVECLLLIQASHSAGPWRYESSHSRISWGRETLGVGLSDSTQVSQLNWNFRETKHNFLACVSHTLFWSLSQAADRRLHKEGKVLRNAEGGFLSRCCLCGTSSARPLGPAPLRLWNYSARGCLCHCLTQASGSSPRAAPQPSHTPFWFPASRCSGNTCWMDECAWWGGKKAWCPGGGTGVGLY